MSSKAALFKANLEKASQAFTPGPGFLKRNIEQNEQKDAAFCSNVSSNPLMLTAKPRIKVLLAEDNKVNIYLAKAILGKLNIEIEVANNGKEAVEKVKAEDFDVILMDIHMPLVDGIEATKIIRALPNLKKALVPIIALTADDVPSSPEEYHRLGINDFQSKPFQGEEIYQKIIKLITEDTDLQKDAGSAGVQPEGGQKQCNLQYLEEVSLGNREFIHEIISLFLSQVPFELDSIQSAIHKKELSAVRHLAHKLKSTASMVGAEDMHARLKKIETLANTESGNEIPLQIQVQLDEIVAKLDAVMNELRSYMAMSA